MTADQIRQSIKQAIKKSEYKQNTIAEKCNIDKGNFSNFLNGKCGLSVNKLNAVFKLLSIDLKIK